MTKKNPKDGKRHEPLKFASVYDHYDKIVSTLCTMYTGDEKLGKKCAIKIFDRIDKELRTFDAKMGFDLYTTGIINQEVLLIVKEEYDRNGALPSRSWFAEHVDIWDGGGYNEKRDKLMVEQIFLCLRKISLSKK